MRQIVYNISLQLMLQTLAVSYFMFVFLFSPVVVAIGAFYLWCYTSYWWIVVLYSAWMIYDRNAHSQGSYATRWMRNQRTWKYFSQYFPMKLKKTVDLLADKNYILGSHPHGILSLSTYANFGTEGTDWSEIFPEITPHLVTLAVQFYFPFRRELLLMTGAISSSAASIKHILNQPNKGKAVAIALGGAEEALDSHADNFSLKLLVRKGFAKIALEAGAYLIPVYNFGETNTFRQINNSKGTLLRNAQLKMKSIFGFTLPLFYGQGIFEGTFGLLPFRTNITTIVGTPIPVQKTLNPSQDEIDELHAEYCRQLVILFDQHKTDYGIMSDTKLNIY